MRAVIEKEIALLCMKLECGLPNDHVGRLTSATLVLIIKKILGSAQVPKLGRLLIKIDSSASIP